MAPAITIAATSALHWNRMVFSSCLRDWDDCCYATAFAGNANGELLYYNANTKTARSISPCISLVIIR
jgi:hypothetical protein